MSALWLIVLGLVAWPVAIAVWLDRRQTIKIEKAASESAHRPKWEESSFPLKHGEAATKLIEQHDALIAVLWATQFGFEDGELGSHGGMVEHMGMKPEWETQRQEALGPICYMQKADKYAWGTWAESIQVGDDDA